MGQCPSCSEWNTLHEEVLETKNKKHLNLEFSQDCPLTLEEVSCDEEPRASTGLSELDRVLGGGIIKGSLTLVGGEPGIGKSTLLLQVVGNLTAKRMKALYVSAEESLTQVKMSDPAPEEIDATIETLRGLIDE